LKIDLQFLRQRCRKYKLLVAIYSPSHVYNNANSSVSRSSIFRYRSVCEADIVAMSQ